MNGTLSDCQADSETRCRPCRLSMRAACENRNETGCICRIPATPGISTQPCEWALSPVRPTAVDLGVITQVESDSQQRMLFPIAACELQSIGRRDFPGLPEQWLFERLRLTRRLFNPPSSDQIPNSLNHRSALTRSHSHICSPIFDRRSIVERVGALCTFSK